MSYQFLICTPELTGGTETNNRSNSEGEARVAIGVSGGTGAETRCEPVCNGVNAASSDSDEEKARIVVVGSLDEPGTYVEGHCTDVINEEEAQVVADVITCDPGCADVSANIVGTSCPLFTEDSLSLDREVATKANSIGIPTVLQCPGCETTRQGVGCSAYTLIVVLHQFEIPLGAHSLMKVGANTTLKTTVVERGFHGACLNRARFRPAKILTSVNPHLDFEAECSCSCSTVMCCTGEAIDTVNVATPSVLMCLDPIIGVETTADGGPLNTTGDSIVKFGGCCVHVENHSKNKGALSRIDEVGAKILIDQQEIKGQLFRSSRRPLMTGKRLTVLENLNKGCGAASMVVRAMTPPTSLTVSHLAASKNSSVAHFDRLGVSIRVPFAPQMTTVAMGTPVGCTLDKTGLCNAATVVVARHGVGRPSLGIAIEFRQPHSHPLATVVAGNGSGHNLVSIMGQKRPTDKKGSVLGTISVVLMVGFVASLFASVLSSTLSSGTPGVSKVSGATPPAMTSVLVSPSKVFKVGRSLQGHAVFVVGVYVGMPGDSMFGETACILCPRASTAMPVPVVIVGMSSAGKAVLTVVAQPPDDFVSLVVAVSGGAAAMANMRVNSAGCSLPGQTTDKSGMHKLSSASSAAITTVSATTLTSPLQLTPPAVSVSSGPSPGVSSATHLLSMGGVPGMLNSGANHGTTPSGHVVLMRTSQFTMVASHYVEVGSVVHQQLPHGVTATVVTVAVSIAHTTAVDGRKVVKQYFLGGFVYIFWVWVFHFLWLVDSFLVGY